MAGTGEEHRKQRGEPTRRWWTKESGTRRETAPGEGQPEGEGEGVGGQGIATAGNEALGERIRALRKKEKPERSHVGRSQ